MTGLEALEVAAESELHLAEPGELRCQARLLALQRFFGFGEPLMAPGELVTPRSHPGLLLFERRRCLLRSVDGLGDGGTRGDELLNLALGGTDARFELRQEVGEIGELNCAGEKAGLLFVTLQVDQASLHPEAVASEEGHAGMRARQPFRVAGCRDKVRRWQRLGNFGLEAEGVAK